MVKNENRYVGIDYARVVCSYWVVCIHFCGFDNMINDFFLLKKMAVPIFMFISFFLTANIFTSLNVIGLKKRMVRLYVPLCFWGGGIFYNQEHYGKKAVDQRAVVGTVVWKQRGKQSGVLVYCGADIHIGTIMEYILSAKKVGYAGSNGGDAGCRGNSICLADFGHE